MLINLLKLLQRTSAEKTNVPFDAMTSRHSVSQPAVEGMTCYDLITPELLNILMLLILRCDCLVTAEDYSCRC